MFSRLFEIAGIRYRFASVFPKGAQRLRIESLEPRYAPSCTFQDPDILCDSGGGSIQLRLLADHSATQVIVNAMLLGTTSSRLFHIDGGTGPGPSGLTVDDSAFPDGERYVIDPAVRIPALGFTVDYTNLRSLNVIVAAGPNAIDIRKTVVVGQNAVTTRQGDNTITVGYDGILKGVGDVQIVATAAHNSLIVDDARFVGATTYRMTSNDLTTDRLPGLDIHYEGTIQALALNTSAGDDQINVQGTLGTAATIINTADSMNTIYLERSSGSLTVNGGGGRNLLYLGTELGGYGHVTIHGNGSDYLNVSDANYSEDDTYTLTDSSLTVAGLPRFRLDYDGLERLNFTPGPGNDTINIPSTAPGTLTAVQSGFSPGVINVGDGGELDFINRLDINALGKTLYVDDSAYASGDTYTFTTYLALGRAPGFLLDYFVRQMFLKTSHGNNILNIQGGAPPTTIDTGDGDNTVQVEGAGNALAINTGSGNNAIRVGVDQRLPVSFDLTVHGGLGSTTLAVDDSAELQGSQYTITDTTILVGVVPNLQVSYTGITGLTLSAGAGPNTINVESTVADTMTVLNGGADDNTFNFSPTAQDLSTLAGPVVVQSTSDCDTISLFDNGFVDHYTISDFATEVDRLGTILTYTGPSPSGGFSGTIRLFTDPMSTVTDDTVYATLEVNPSVLSARSEGSGGGARTLSLEARSLGSGEPLDLLLKSSLAVGEESAVAGGERGILRIRLIERTDPGLDLWNERAPEEWAAFGHP